MKSQYPFLPPFPTPYPDHVGERRMKAAQTLAPLGAGGKGMKPSEVLLLSNLIKYNPHAWTNLIRHIGPNATFRRIHELAGDKVLVAYRSAAGVHQECLIDLNTAKVADDTN